MIITARFASRTGPTTHTACPQTAEALSGWTLTRSARRPFRCSRCGDDRDTTIPGHCDDCDA